MYTHSTPWYDIRSVVSRGFKPGIIYYNFSIPIIIYNTVIWVSFTHFYLFQVLRSYHLADSNFFSLDRGRNQIKKVRCLFVDNTGMYMYICTENRIVYIVLDYLIYMCMYKDQRPALP